MNVADNSSDADGGRPLRTAVVGCGALACGQHLPNIKASSRLELYACCDPSQKVLDQCSTRFAPTKLLTDYHDLADGEKVDLIVLATTEKLRLPVIQFAAEHGIAIYVEKPIATTLKEAYEIQKVVNEAKIPFCIGHNRRSAPAMIDAHAIFTNHMNNPKPTGWRWNREGDLRPNLPEDGVPGMSVRINDDWHSWKSWVFDKTQAPMGPMLFEMTHFTDICNWFLNSEPVEVVALESGMLNHGVVIRYASGAIATISMSSNGSFGYPKELYEIFGQGAAIAIDHMVEIRTDGIVDAPARKTYLYKNDRHPDVGKEGGISGWLAKKQIAAKEAVAKNDQMLQFTAEPDKGHAAQLDRFVDQIQGKGPQVCGIDDTIMATRVAVAAVKAAHEKRPVRIDEV